MADSSKPSTEKPAVKSDCPDGSKKKGKTLRGGRLVHSRSLDYEKKVQQAPEAGALKGDGKPPEGRKATELRRKDKSTVGGPPHMDRMAATNPGSPLELPGRRAWTRTRLWI